MPVVYSSVLLEMVKVTRGLSEEVRRDLKNLTIPSNIVCQILCLFQRYKLLKGMIKPAKKLVE